MDRFARQPAVLAALPMLLAAGAASLVVVPGREASAAGRIQRHGGALANVYLFSPDGNRATAFTHNRHGPEDKLAFAPAWSPGGGQIAFSETRCHSCSSELHIAKLGAPRDWLGRRIGYGFKPTWSPRGGRIAYVGAQGRIYSMDTRGRNRRLVVEGAIGNDDPAWSPDGTRIAFARQLTASLWQIYSVRADGSGLKQVTRGSASAVNPCWSPDGRSLAFARQASSGLWQIAVVPARGGTPRQLSDGRSSDADPTWSPDGSKIAFVRQDASATAVFVMAADGTHVRRLTPDRLNAVQPAWSPGGKEIALVQRHVH